MKKTFLIFLPIVLLLVSCGHTRFVPGKDRNLADYVGVVPVDNKMIDPKWNIWCGSMVEGYDGKYHLYYSRWPRKTGHEGWISHSEIAYAVADKPEGPYRHVNVALGYVDSIRWDGAMAHNPYIIKYEGKYYLYYIGTHGDYMPPTEKLKPYGQEWWTRRNTQRIGVAVADNPAGPWTRFDKPVLSNSEDSTAFDAMLVSNPAVCIGRDGKFVMLYKAVCKNGKLSGGKVRFSVAFADSPIGPFKKTNKLIFQPEDPNSKMVAEDPFIWYDKKKDHYYAIVRDVVRQFTGKDSGGLALMESDDAINWHPASYPKVLPAVLKWSDGTTYDANKNSFERPFLFFDKKGVPQLLFGTFGINNNGIRREHSFNGRVPFNI